MRGNIERRIGQRSSEVPGLVIVAEQHERHARHEADVFESLPLFGRERFWRGLDSHVTRLLSLLSRSQVVRFSLVRAVGRF